MIQSNPGDFQLPHPLQTNIARNENKTKINMLNNVLRLKTETKEERGERERRKRGVFSHVALVTGEWIREGHVQIQ
jgi:hypothetical protein